MFWDNSYSARVFGSTFKRYTGIFPGLVESASFDQEADFFGIVHSLTEPCL